MWPEETPLPESPWTPPALTHWQPRWEWTHMKNNPRSRELGTCLLQAAALSQSCGRMLRTLSTSKDGDPTASLACPRAAPPSEFVWELQGGWIRMMGNCLLLVPTAKHSF